MPAAILAKEYPNMTLRVNKLVGRYGLTLFVESLNVESPVVRQYGIFARMTYY